jgi:hypothetical protein
LAVRMLPTRIVERPTKGWPSVVHKSILLVDYENVGQVELVTIPNDVSVPFFFGASQKSVPTEFMKAALKLGERFVPIDIEGQGTNALDFHIAYYLGEFLTADPESTCIILSKDKGFDPLVKHLQRRGFKVRRASSIAEAFPDAVKRAPAAVVARVSKRTTANAASAPAAPWESALAWLRGMQARLRPRKRKSLIAHLRTHFGSKLAEPELQQVVDRLISEKKLSEVDGVLAYHL